MQRALIIAAALGCVTSAALAAQVDPGAFQPYAGGLIDRLAIGTERLAAEVDAGDLAGAKEAWIAARVGWERGETFLGEYFPEADEAIDSWPEADAGFHALEPLLFEAGDLERARPLATALLGEVGTLQKQVSEHAFDGQGLINGLAGIAFEIGDAKASGGESPFAGTSLSDMQDNLAGIEALYALSFARAVAELEPALHRRIVERLVDLGAALAVPSIDALDQSRVMALSEQLAGDFQDAAQILGLEPPALGG
jgi:iron uptake system EfeUOB component EfeO/EfeM